MSRTSPWRGPNSSRRVFLAGAGASAVALTTGSQRALAASYNFRMITSTSARPAVAAAIEAFKAKYPGSNVNLTAADIDQLYTTTRVTLSSGTAADVLTTQMGNGNPITIGQLAPGGYLDDLSGQPFAPKLSKSLDAVVRIDGKLYVLPIALSMIGAIYNTKMFAELGLSPPKTWTQFLDLCQKLKDKGIAPLAAGNGTNWINQLITYSLLPSLVYADNPNFNADRQQKKVKFATSGWREALEKYAELNKRGYFSANPTGTSFDEQLQLLAAGKAGMAIVVNSAFANTFKFAGNRDFAMMPVPGSDDPAKLWIAASASSGFSINSKAAAKDAAVAFLNFLAEPDTVAAFSGAGMQPPVLPASANPDVDKLYVLMMPAYREGRSTIFMDQTWPNPRPQQIHNAGVQELLTGRTTPEDILKRMDEAYDS
jgi:raffinose/stachyose/melibiose transport system substrate-binding protein